MTWILLAAVIIAIVVVIIIKLSSKDDIEPTNYPYQINGGLFSPAERSFFGVLEQAVGVDAKIFGKIRVADVMTPRKGLSRSEWQKAFNKIAAKHFDFLLCSNDDLSVICAIELDDSSHKSIKRQERDDFLRGACEAASIPLIQIPAKAGYVISDIRQLLAPHLEIQEKPIQIDAQQNTSSDKFCPKCDSQMVMRVAEKGTNAGKQFWGCSAYPKCRHTEAINV